MSTQSQAMVREHNLSLVLRLVHNEGPISRAKIAQKVGLNKSTISSLVETLLESELIHETGINSVGTGRPSRMLEINPQAGGIIGVEFGVDHVSTALTDFAGNILWRKNEPTDMLDPKEKTLDKAIQFTQHAITESKKLGLLPLGIGIGTPGTVNLDEGLLIFAPNLQWHNVPFRAIFHKHTDLNVFVENDANGAAVAENLFGAGKGSKNFILIFAGVGIGSGLFLNGELYRGHIGFAGEIGHAPITAKPFESPCHCGNQGCWETYANKFAIIRRVQSRLDARRESVIPELMRKKNEPLSVELIREAAKLEDKETIEALKETGEAMGLGIATLASILNPEKVILGGPLSILGDYLLPEIESVIKKRVLPELRPNVEVLLSRFDKDASLFGAISIVVDNIYTNPSQAPRR